MKLITCVLILLLTNQSSLAEIVSPDQIISMRNADTGIKEYDYNILNDNYSVELAYSTNLNLMKASDLAGYRAQVTIFSQRFNWVGYLSSSDIVLSKATKIQGNFDSDLETMNFLQAGLGLGGRTDLITNFINKSNIYDEYSAVFTYSSASTPVLDNSFTGFGLVASYGVFIRTSKLMHWGVRADYHLLSLEDSTTDETNPVELSAGWLSISFAAGMHF